MKKYQVWAWDQYYPSGGANNWLGSFDTLDEAREMCAEHRTGDGRYDHYDITIFDVESDKFEVVG